ncbi:MAG: CRISPR-associated endonuclease Cas2 [Deltaproteobacteria bacterium]|nr:MAG: CRISPR-associated endonuclease Cas2 [Deltaproteobacteria bacterium]
MRTVIAFDISNDRTRYRAVRALLDYAVRVQKSVFEAPDLSHAAYLRLRSQLEGLYDPSTDSLRYYRLCAACCERIHHEGVAPGILDPPEPFRII